MFLACLGESDGDVSRECANEVSQGLPADVRIEMSLQCAVSGAVHTDMSVVYRIMPAKPIASPENVQ